MKLCTYMTSSSVVLTQVFGTSSETWITIINWMPHTPNDNDRVTVYLPESSQCSSTVPILKGCTVLCTILYIPHFHDLSHVPKVLRFAQQRNSSHICHHTKRLILRTHKIISPFSRIKFAYIFFFARPCAFGDDVYSTTNRREHVNPKVREEA